MKTKKIKHIKINKIISMMMNYTKHGKNRYLIIELDEIGNVCNKIEQNISNKNVISKMHELGITDCDRNYKGNNYLSQLKKVWASDRKQMLNQDGYGLFNLSGYYVDVLNHKVKYVVIDMTQKEKHPSYISKFY